MSKSILNITNGDVFNEYLISNFDGIAIPFCECMMNGETVTEIYSDSFVKLRCKALDIDEGEYRSKMYVHDMLTKRMFTEIHLWFGRDTFCQMNLLTLLAYLEQIGYGSRVLLNYIDDESFEVIEADIPVSLGIYKDLYKRILISKEMPENIGVLCKRGIELYFDYHSSNGELVKLIKENSDMKMLDLVCLLLKSSHEYGLSDLQTKKLIGSTLETM
ncbi:MAG: hypothetical protein E7591_07915 [Ruminococcaceae bacterium]|nr:hypothetical protein [Oscillospiraceae bacterium]